MDVLPAVNPKVACSILGLLVDIQELPLRVFVNPKALGSILSPAFAACRPKAFLGLLGHIQCAARLHGFTINL